MSSTEIDLKFGEQKREYTKSDHYKNNYKHWRDYREDINEGFIMVPKNIIEYLGSIRSKAINLYLYYCYRAQTKTGESWAAVDTMARELSTSTKSITNWNNELENLGLIRREAGNKSSKTTYLLPISDYYYFERVLSAGDYLEMSNQKIDGKLVSIFHLYQWRKNRDNDKYEVPYHVFALNFERTHIVDETNLEAEPFKINKTVLFEGDLDQILNKESNIINKNTPLYRFDSQQLMMLQDKIFENITDFKKIPKVGIAITAGVNLQKGNARVNMKYLKKLIKGVQNNEYNDLPKAELIKNK